MASKQLKIQALLIYCLVWIRLKCKTVTEKLQEENVKKKPLNTGFGNSFFFFEMIPKVQGTKSEVNMWDYIKLTSFYVSNETVSKIKRQCMGW